MLIRLRSRDGLERIQVEESANVGALKHVISSTLQIPEEAMTLSLNQRLLLSKTPTEFQDMSSDLPSLASLGITHGSVVFLHYVGERQVASTVGVNPWGASYGKKMTMDDLIARQMRIERQEKSHCSSISFERDAANQFQLYVHDSLAFSIKRAGFMYGSVAQDSSVRVEFIYEPPQQGSEDAVVLVRDEEEERRVSSIAHGLGLRRVGFIFAQATDAQRDYTLSNTEVRQMAELQAESSEPWFVTGVVKLEVNEQGAGDVHFEAFQLSDLCLRLWKEGWFVDSQSGEPKVSKMNKEVVVLGKDTREVDNDLFLVPVKILDHQGLLGCAFPVENRLPSATMQSLKAHLERTKSLPYVQRLSDFHVLLFISKFLDINTDLPQLTHAVLTKGRVPEGYQLIIESLASG